MRSNKCNHCGKYLGNSFKDFPEGTTDDGKNYWCNKNCYDLNKLGMGFIDFLKYISNELGRNPDFYPSLKIDINRKIDALVNNEVKKE